MITPAETFALVIAAIALTCVLIAAVGFGTLLLVSWIKDPAYMGDE